MSHAGITGMRAAGDDLVNVAEKFTDDQWHASSAAAGWSVHDVVVHVGSLLELLQAAVAGGDSPPIGIEQLNDQVVAQRRDWTPAQTVQFLRDQLSSALDTFAALQEEPARIHSCSDARPRQLSTARDRRHVRLRHHHAPALGHPRATRADRVASSTVG